MKIWKMNVLSKQVIFRFQPFILQGVVVSNSLFQYQAFVLGVYANDSPLIEAVGMTECLRC